MDDKKQKDYKKPTLLLLLVAAGALVTACAAFSLRQEAAVPAQAGTTQNDMSYYTPKPAASQESPASAQPEQDGPYRVALYEGKIGFSNWEPLSHFSQRTWMCTCCRRGHCPAA